MSAAQGWVPVRVTSMAGVNLAMFRFDYDLTFAALLMHPDGTIYHTFAGRDWTHADSHLDLGELAALLRATLPEHAAYAAAPAPPTLDPPVTIEQLAPMAKRIADGKAPKCMHCHMVNDMRFEAARDAGRLRPDDAFGWPDPVQVGWRPATVPQAALAEVRADSPAAAAGMRAGDRLVQVGDVRIATFGDIARALHRAPERGGPLAVTWQRDGTAHQAALALAPGWKRPDPAVFAWRPSKWHLDPRPGFGGPRLTPDACAALGLDRDAFAFRVQYIVTWGPAAYTGRNAQRAGLRTGDVVLRVGGKSDFTGVDHFHAWFRLTVRPGQQVPIEILRPGDGGAKRLEIRLTAVVE